MSGVGLKIESHALAYKLYIDCYTQHSHFCLIAKFNTTSTALLQPRLRLAPKSCLTKLFSLHDPEQSPITQPIYHLRRLIHRSRGSSATLFALGWCAILSQLKCKASILASSVEFVENYVMGFGVLYQRSNKSLQEILSW